MTRELSAFKGCFSDFFFFFAFICGIFSLLQLCKDNVELKVLDIPGIGFLLLGLPFARLQGRLPDWNFGRLVLSFQSRIFLNAMQILFQLVENWEVALWIFLQANIGRLLNELVSFCLWSCFVSARGYPNESTVFVMRMWLVEYLSSYIFSEFDITRMLLFCITFFLLCFMTGVDTLLGSIYSLIDGSSSSEDTLFNYSSKNKLELEICNLVKYHAISFDHGFIPCQRLLEVVVTPFLKLANTLADPTNTADMNAQQIEDTIFVGLGASLTSILTVFLTENNKGRVHPPFVSARKRAELVQALVERKIF